MADKKITELTNITGANLVDADEFVVVDISADETKAITLGELKEAFDAGSGFVRITGDTMTGDLSFGDNDKAIFGAGSDLQIYHDGSNSFIKDLGTGDLLIQASNIQLEDPDGNNYLRGVDGGILQLYHSGGEVMRTASTGVDVTGTVVASDSVQIDSGGTGFLVGGGQTGTTAIGKLHNSSGLLTLDTDGTRSIKLATGTTQRLRIDGSGGDISFYEDTGTTPKMVWKSADERLGIGTSLPSRTLSVNGVAGFGNGTIETIISFSDRGIFGTQSNHALEIRTNGEEAVRIDTSGDLTVKGGRIFVNESDNGNTAIGLTRDADEGYVQVYSAGAITSQIRGNGDSYFNGGNVGIGTSLPSYRLDLGTVSNGTTLFNVTNGSNSNLRFKVEDGVSTIMNTGGSGELAFTSGGTTERMRIDSSGNLLVGTTVSALHSSPTESGARLYDGGIVTAGAGTVAYFNRNGAGGDGTIIDLRKDGAPVGSIGTLADDLSIGNLDTGLIFQGAGDRISPFNPATNSYRDAAIDLGKDDRRFKDLYLSGTVNTDSVSTASADLTAIAKDISDTAVDLFVYDTSKDSDGGKWRKRTQGTSWYNETLNTSTRGSRKEFPAVAVIVLENYALSIYDGDDPDLPLWKEMTMTSAANTYWFGFGAGYPFPKAVSALNGEISLVNNDTGNSSAGLTRVRFIQDDIYRNAYSISYSGKYAYNIANYNTINGSYDQNASIIVSNRGNDVAMTVLDNAPIDAATGLPVPTIAVATANGVSVIKDDGTVVDHTNGAGYDTAYQVDFLDDYRYVGKFNESTSASNAGVFIVENFTSSSPTFNLYNSRNTYNNSYGPSVTTNVGSTGGVPKNLSAIYTGEKEFAVASDRFLAQVSEGNTLPSGMVAYTASSYATGYLNGDIKLATLSDTDDTDVTGSELVTNGDFSSATGWTAQTGWSIDTGAGTASCDGNSGVFLYQTSGFPANTRITISFDITSYTSGSVRAGSTGIAPSSYFSSVGSHSITYTTASNNPAGVEMYSSSFVGTIDNVSARIIEEDRSVNGNGLQVFGTVTKNPVATGADLVAYSGFGGVTPSTYLKQPAGPNLTTGTLALVWYKAGIFGTTYGFMGQGGSTSAGYGFGTNASSGTLNGRIVASGGTVNIGSSSVIADNTWKCIAVTYDGSAIKVYINGVLDTTNTGTSGDITSSDDFYVGAGITSVGFRGGSGAALALARVSATVLSPEQIAKIYEDEKVLFQENAQATLYAASPASGSPDAVTALAYDDSTELLHVGTDNGRSVFQGLRRIDNTTDAITAAISASNGLVAED